MSKGGLAFLNKKSWHTQGIKMQERVWRAEQKAKEEEKLIAQKMKELAEERKIEELRKIQEEAGLITKHQVNRLDWMYVGPGKIRK